MKRLAFIFSAMLSPATAFLQTAPGVDQPPSYGAGAGFHDGPPAPYAYVREADIAWEKRIWRNIDVREKLNQAFFYPLDISRDRVSFMQLVIKHILDGSIYAFEDEDFFTPIETGEIRRRLVYVGDSVGKYIYDAEGRETIVMAPGPIDSTWMQQTFSGLTLKEDWFFDSKRSVMEVRIIGIGFNAPYRGREELGPACQFWVYYPACRTIFARYAAFNPRNDAQPISFDDIFRKRMFHTTVVKESNVYDRSISQYAYGIDALLESERVKWEIFRWEHDLWQY
jgi:gliding motility associated protien GldN